MDQCCGRGVKVVTKRLNIPKEKRQNYIISEYLSNLHLIEGYKYDLRIYILVSSFDPLRVYIYNDGLVRFATEKFEEPTKKQSRFMHLTNYSVNKKSKNYIKNNNENQDNFTSKWSLK